MNKKRIIIIIIALVLIIIGILVFKFVYYDVVNKKYYFNPIPIKNIKTNYTVSDKVDKDIYKDNIITEPVLSIDYIFYDNKKSIVGKVTIENGYIFITSDNESEKYKLSNAKFKTMYKKDYVYAGIYIFLISENEELYFLELTTNDASKARIEKIKTSYKVKNFVNLDFILDINASVNTLFVLSEDGNIYDVASSIRYNKNIKSLYNKYYIFEDNTITNIYGYMLQDKDGKEYKIKYCFETFEDNEFSDKNSILIITEDNTLLYISEDNWYVYEFQETVENIDFNVKYPFTKSKLSMTFADGASVSFTAACNRFYCPSKLDI